MANETNTEEPWYHGVKWHSDWVECNVNGTRDHYAAVYDEAGKAICDTFNADNVTMENPDGDGRYWDEVGMRRMQLVAAAPETATERDNLKQEVERLREENDHLRYAVETGIVTLDRGKKQSAAMAEMYEAIGFQSERIEANRPFNFAEETIEEAKANWLARAALRTGG